MDETCNMLLGSMKESISEAVPRGRIGVAFSGGVDSTLVAKVCDSMGIEAVLLTVGLAGSHDISFAKEVGGLLGCEHRTAEIGPGTFRDVCLRVRRSVGTDSMSWNEVGIAFYYVSEMAKGLGLETVVTANGIDELFCGYDAYRRELAGGGSERDLLHLVDAKLENELRMMEAVNSISSGFGVRIVQPLLSPRFVRDARTVPLSEKIRGPGDMQRKHIIRRLARDVGVPEISYSKPKKSLQYGSNIHKELLRVRRGP